MRFPQPMKGHADGTARRGQALPAFGSCPGAVRRLHIQGDHGRGVQEEQAAAPANCGTRVLNATPIHPDGVAAFCARRHR